MNEHGEESNIHFSPISVGLNVLYLINCTAQLTQHTWHYMNNNNGYFFFFIKKKTYPQFYSKYFEFHIDFRVHIIRSVPLESMRSENTITENNFD